MNELEEYYTRSAHKINDYARLPILHYSTMTVMIE